jgi:UDPglucose--hexose-1-phosphate uridylyltransferase
MPTSEFRQDFVSGDWVLLAPGRVKRAHHSLTIPAHFHKNKISTCPFEDLKQATSGKPLVQYGEDGRWRLAVIENKYPVVTHLKSCPILADSGPYHVLGGAGRHELLITRSHKDNFSELSASSAAEVLTGCADRIKMFKKDPCLQYAFMFQNYGERAGASQAHPHYQLLALPVIPPHMEHSLASAKRYFATHHHCGHCRVIEFELKHGGRIVYENSEAIALAPYASRSNYEVRVFPKKHFPFFERTPHKVLAQMAGALQSCLQGLKKTLGNPAYNFYIHTAPLQNQNQYESYHWHIEILPALNSYAGFELGTGVIINEMDPDEVATALRKALLKK